MCNEHGIREVLLAFAHLLAVGGEDDAVDDEVLEGFAPLHGSRDHHQRVEPATGLIQTLCDEVSWETLVEFLLRNAKWIVDLREGHASRFKPAIENFWNTT